MNILRQETLFKRKKTLQRSYLKLKNTHAKELEIVFVTFGGKKLQKLFFSKKKPVSTRKNTNFVKKNINN